MFFDFVVSLMHLNARMSKIQQCVFHLYIVLVFFVNMMEIKLNEGMWCLNLFSGVWFSVSQNKGIGKKCS